MSIFPVNINLLEDVEFDIVAGNKASNLSSGPRLLGPKLIAREGEDGESTSFSSILLMETNQLLVVHLGLSSLARYVNNHHNLTLVLVEVY